MRVLLVDNLDSFSYMLKDYVGQCGATCDVIRTYEPLMQTNTSVYDAIVLSPGPGTPDKAGFLMPFLNTVINTKPILGVCLGHQAIGSFFGADLVKADLPRHGKVDLVLHQGNDPLFDGVPLSFEATRYHSLLLKQINPPLHITAKSMSGEVMSLRHESLPVWGIQFHPESCKTQNGIRIMKNFLALARNKY